MADTSKKAILVVSFGTSYPDTLQKNIQAIENDIAAAFPAYTIRRAFTSGMILRKLKSRDNMRIDRVAQALEKLAGEGFETVICQPTHILNGEEFEDILADLKPFEHRFKTLKVGAPLLTDTADYRALTQILSDIFPAQHQTALCLMGHGSSHFADTAYAALDYHFKSTGRPDIFVGTVEGFPDLDTLRCAVGKTDAKKIILTPLMVVAGDHATNDMASDEADSWKSTFEAAGYAVRCVLKGLGEYRQIRELYISHVRAAAEGA